MDRYPSGQIKSDPTLIAPMEFARMREMVAKDALHRAWVCELWRRAHQGQITNEQRIAGDMFIKLRDEHRRVCNGSPPEHPKVASLDGRGGKKHDIDLDTLNDGARQAELRYIEGVKRRWDGACSALNDRGTSVWRAVTELCFSNEVQWHSQFLLAREGLQVLVVHFGLTRPVDNSRRD